MAAFNDYVELHARSAFSLLAGASTPEALARRARDVGLGALALTDLEDVGGSVRFATACSDEGVRPLFGAELTLSVGGSVVALAESREGWSNLCRLASRARMENGRGRPSVSFDALAAHARGLVLLTGGRGGALDLAAARSDDAARAFVGTLAEIAPGALYVEVHDHKLAEDVPRLESRLALARALALPWVVTNDVRHATPQDKATLDALTCLRHEVTLESAGDLLFPNDARCLRSPRDVAHAFRDAPSGVLRTREIAERLAFHLLTDLRPTLPDFRTEDGRPTDADAQLAALAEEGLRERVPRPSGRHLDQLAHELGVIRRTRLAGYFLIVHDVVRFARQRGILVQGRGSAANSVVCFALGITAIDPVRMELLFERFLTEDRNEAPDIDLDIAHRDREDVLQYVYARYGREHAAMVCNAQTFHAKGAVRDAVRVLGLPAELGDRLAREVGAFVPTDASPRDEGSGADALASGGFERAGLDPRDPRLRALLHVVRGLEGLPRHRSIHSGGFVLTAERLDGVCILEPAAMQGRTVLQWDKDDLDPVGLVKIDLLGLGMLTLLGEALTLVRRHRDVELRLDRLPVDDPETYAMIRRADTVGVFQIESRAQMSSLPRTAPRTFYDLVVQVALVRPGPIQGEMVHPYIRRRRGEEPVTYLHPSLEPVLARTLGVPLFQEQGMKCAIAAAGFSPSQADELRRTMSKKRNQARMARHALELFAGMAKNGIDRGTAERIVKQLAAFASYGFPESHAASFAILVYASAYLKRHFTPEFHAALLNAQPLGFYPLGSLIADARRAGVVIRPPDLTRSAWLATLEPTHEGPHPLALRLGLVLVQGLGVKARGEVEHALERRPYASLDELAERGGLSRATLRALAEAGALDALAGHRRAAVYDVLRLGRPRSGPFDLPAADPRPADLPPESRAEAVLTDYATFGASARAHPLELLRAKLVAEGIPRLAELPERRPGPVTIVGLVNTRQRPQTAKGTVFLALEDESGMVNVIVRPELFAARRDAIGNPVLRVEGMLQKSRGALDIVAERIEAVRDLAGYARFGSHDFH